MFIIGLGPKMSTKNWEKGQKKQIFCEKEKFCEKGGIPGAREE
jgi:hypothetical protein